MKYFELPEIVGFGGTELQRWGKEQQRVLLKSASLSIQLGAIFQLLSVRRLALIKVI